MTEQQQRELQRGFRALADSTRHMNASQAVEAAVLAEMGSADRAAVAAARVHLPPRLLPLAAALILAIGGALWIARSPHLPDVVQPVGFVALPGASWLPEMESATIVRLLVPVPALPAYGIAIQPDVTSDTVLAELLVAQDGQPRAIRLVTDSD